MDATIRATNMDVTLAQAQVVVARLKELGWEVDYVIHGVG